MEPGKKKPSATAVVKKIKRRTKRIFTAEEKIKIVVEGLRGEDKHCRHLPQVRHSSKLILHLEQGVHGGRQEEIKRGCAQGGNA